MNGSINPLKGRVPESNYCIITIYAMIKFIY